MTPSAARRLQSGAIVSDRISYVVTPDGKVGLSLIDSDPIKHVTETLGFRAPLA